MKKFLLFFPLMILSVSMALGSDIRFEPQELHQPDGKFIQCFASGDEYYHWLHDSLGYTIIHNPADGYFYYATSENGQIVPSVFKVGEIDPQNTNLKPWIKISEAEYKKRIKRFHEIFQTDELLELKLKSAAAGSLYEGTLNNLVVFIKFQGGANFTQSKSHYAEIFNGTSSLHSYYQEVSYSKFDIISHFYPTSENSQITLPYEDFHPRSFYQPYDKNTNPNGYNSDAEQVQRLNALLMNALESIKNQVDKSLVLDKDNNGKIDNLSFIIQGSADGWGDLLWPHQSRITQFDVMINNIKASEYTLQVENAGVTTFCHEMFHLLGAPDLYHYSYDGIAPVGKWDLMEQGSGHMGAYMKFKYSNSTWIKEMPEITKSGRYSLKPLTSPDKNVYKFSPKDVVTSEFFVLEYRRKTDNSVDKNIPGSGLLIYRINPKYSGNADGPPDEVYVYRPQGGLKINGQVDEAASENETGYVLGKSSSPAFLSDGTVSGIKISNVSEAGDSILFDVQLERSSEANIESFFLMGQNSNAIINSNTGTVYSNVDAGTNLAKSKPIIKISELAKISPGASSLVDLSAPFVYLVTAENGTEKKWTIYVDSQISNQSAIDSIRFVGISKIKTVINNQDHTVLVAVPVNTDLSNLFPVIYTSPASAIEPNPGTITDFSEPVVFRVKAEDGVSYTDWTVDVSYSTNASRPLSQTQKYKLEVIPNQGINIIKNTEKEAVLNIYTVEGILRHRQILKSHMNPVKLVPGRVYIISIDEDGSRFYSKLFF